MTENILTFRTRKSRIDIDYSRCIAAGAHTSTPSCGFACVKACRLYGRNILKIEENRPVLAVTEAAEIERLDNECLACEYNCHRHGSDCISIDIPLE